MAAPARLRDDGYDGRRERDHPDSGDRESHPAGSRAPHDADASERPTTDEFSARSETFQWFARGSGLALGAALVYIIFNAAALAAPALLLVFMAVLLGSALEPMIGQLRQRLPVGRGAAVLLVYASFLLLVVGIALLVVPDALSQAAQIEHRLPSLFDDLENWSAGLRPVQLSQSVQAIVESARRTFESNAAPDTNTVLRVGLTVGEAVIIVGTLLALVFFWLTEHARLQRYVLSFVPGERRGGTRDAWNEVETRLGLWVRGQLTLMATMAGMTAVLYTIVGLPAPLLLALWAGIAEAIPIVGPLLGAIPAVLLAATVSPQVFLITVGVYVVLQFVEGNVLVPLIMRNTIGISPFLVIASLTIGAEIGGIPGAFLAVPVTAAIEVILERLQARDTPVPQDPAAAATPPPEEAEAMGKALPDGSASDRE